jgi:hypothetical protein
VPSAGHPAGSPKAPPPHWQSERQRELPCLPPALR